MIKILGQTIHSIMGFFDRIVVKETERVFEFQSQVLRYAPNRGGERLK